MEADGRLKTYTLADKAKKTGENLSLSDFYFSLCFRYLVSIRIVFPSLHSQRTTNINGRRRLVTINRMCEKDMYFS